MALLVCGGRRGVCVRMNRPLLLARLVSPVRSIGLPFFRLIPAKPEWLLFVASASVTVALT
ncbi:unnamed protein product [Protopolystoma xenopodis]|uniref:Uncharacterized protein n=1 Tax=Protopolystoma xenopodis TaxID=117903 RepID=A0A448XQ03_9PLAT|nr:unnamed protein product [Protopolystoma xenopodis]